MEITATEEFIHQVSFVPTISGLYQLHLNYGGVLVQDSTLGFIVGSSGPQAPPRAVGPGLEKAQVGEETSFTINNIEQPQVQVNF